MKPKKIEQAHGTTRLFCLCCVLVVVVVVFLYWVSILWARLSVQNVPRQQHDITWPMVNTLPQNSGKMERFTLVNCTGFLLGCWFPMCCSSPNHLDRLRLWPWFLWFQFTQKKVMNRTWLVSKFKSTQSGWWFGIFFIFPYIGNSHPIWLSYFSEG